MVHGRPNNNITVLLQRNVKSIYEAKIEGLQTEVKTTKKDLENALNEGGDLRERIKTLEALLKTPSYDTDGQSTKDLQKENLSLNANVPLIERLTKSCCLIAANSLLIANVFSSTSARVT